MSSTGLRNGARAFWHGMTHPMTWLRNLCGGESPYPLIVLFGLNAVDELDRTAFGILLPNIRDEFHLDNTKVLGFVALVSLGALALQVPIAQYADRSKRVPLAIVGALMWGVFSGMTGLATGLVVLAIARSGSSLGKAVIDPTHNSLLADYYPIEARAKVYSTHRAANAVGSFIGPLTAGLLAYAFSWRVPFVVFVVPTVVFAFMVSGLDALRLHNGHWVIIYNDTLKGRTQLAVSVSEDEGRTWSLPWRLVTSPFLNISTLPKGAPVRMTNGQIALPVYHEFFTKLAEMLVLDPVGKVVKKVRIPGSQTNLQPVVLVSNANNAQIFMRSGTAKTIMTSTTNDAGKSWSISQPTML